MDSKETRQKGGVKDEHTHTSSLLHARSALAGLAQHSGHKQREVIQRVGNIFLWVLSKEQEDQKGDRRMRGGGIPNEGRGNTQREEGEYPMRGGGMPNERRGNTQ